MTDLVERLRAAHENSTQRILGSNIFKEAADEIEGLRHELRWAGVALDNGYSRETVKEHLRKVLTGDYAYGQLASGSEK